MPNQSCAQKQKFAVQSTCWTTVLKCIFFVSLFTIVLSHQNLRAETNEMCNKVLIYNKNGKYEYDLNVSISGDSENTLVYSDMIESMLGSFVNINTNPILGESNMSIVVNNNGHISISIVDKESEIFLVYYDSKSPIDHIFAITYAISVFVGNCFLLLGHDREGDYLIVESMKNMYSTCLRSKNRLLMCSPIFLSRELSVSEYLLKEENDNEKSSFVKTAIRCIFFECNAEIDSNQELEICSIMSAFIGSQTCALSNLNATQK